MGVYVIRLEQLSKPQKSHQSHTHIYIYIYIISKKIHFPGRYSDVFRIYLLGVSISFNDLEPLVRFKVPHRKLGPDLTMSRHLVNHMCKTVGVS